MNDELTINITIAERRYPMRIKRNDEEKIRKAAKIINDRILQYRKMYTGKDTQDFMAMSALQFVIELHDLIDKNDTSPVIKQLEEINNGLQKYFTS
jgi:cell division protein ZapA